MRVIGWATRTSGALVTAVGLALMVVPWLSSGVPQGVEWLFAALVMAMATSIAAVGLAVWRGLL